MHTTVFLIRNAETPWNVERRLAGRRELGLSEQGARTAVALVDRFAGIELDELLASPLPRTVETAQPMADARGLEVARDPRLIDWLAGSWEGRTYAEIVADPAFAAMQGRAVDELTFPGGERFADVRTRMLASVSQALQDNQLGAHIAIVSHAGPLRILLSHYLSIPPWDHTRLAISPGGVTILRFSTIDAPPKVTAMNVTGRVLDSLGAAR